MCLTKRDTKRDAEDAYLKSPDTCPYCGCKTLTSTGHAYCGTSHLVVDVMCTSCTKQFTERYALFNISLTEA